MPGDAGQMPVVDGLEAARRIRNSNKQYANIPILALTAHAMVGDKEKLIQAILNIARNAAQAIRGQRGDDVAGEIILRTRIARRATLVKKHFRLALEVQIIDNGPGIPPDIRERMFYPLVSGREGGSGLGLTLAQSFVQQHQGTIDCESRPGFTCFTIRMPLSS